MKFKKITVLATAILMAAGTLVGCGGASSADEDGIAHIKWVTIGNGMPTNYDSWIAKVNEYIEPEIGVNLEMEVIPWGDWDKRRNIIVSTNEPFDIIFGTGNNYIADINLGHIMILPI